MVFDDEYAISKVIRINYFVVNNARKSKNHYSITFHRKKGNVYGND